MVAQEAANVRNGRKTWCGYQEKSNHSNLLCQKIRWGFKGKYYRYSEEIRDIMYAKACAHIMCMSYVMDINVYIMCMNVGE